MLVFLCSSLYFFTLQHKMKNVVWTKGTSGLDGEFQSASEVDFYINQVKILQTNWEIFIFVNKILIFFIFNIYILGSTHF